MSNLITKAFDATKKIAQTVFNGKPNVFTTNDLNIAMEANRFAFDMLAKTTPAIAGAVILPQQNNGSWALNVGVYADTDAFGPYVIAGGAKFKINAGTFPFSMSAADNKKSIYLVGVVAGKSLVTFNNNPTHDISGATFSDGTMLASADHYVFNDMTFSVVHEADIENLIKNNYLVVPLYKIYVTDFASSNFSFIQMYQKPYTLHDPFKVDSVTTLSGNVGFTTDASAGRWRAQIRNGLVILMIDVESNLETLVSGTQFLKLWGLNLDAMGLIRYTKKTLSASIYLKLSNGTNTIIATSGDFGGCYVYFGSDDPIIKLIPKPTLAGFNTIVNDDDNNIVMLKSVFSVDLI